MAICIWTLLGVPYAYGFVMMNLIRIRGLAKTHLHMCTTHMHMCTNPQLRMSAHICICVRNAFGALHIHRYNFSVMSIHAGYPTEGDAPSQHKQQTTPRETTLFKTVSSTTITRTTKCLPVAPSSTTKSRRQLLYVRLTLRLLLKQT